MVLKELSVAKEEDNDFKQFKKEIVEMIRLQAPALKAKVGCKIILSREVLLWRLSDYATKNLRSYSFVRQNVLLFIWCIGLLHNIFLGIWVPGWTA